MAEIADEVGPPPGVFNMLTGDREVSELLVRDPRVDKISFTGSTAAGRRIAGSVERIARCTLELAVSQRRSSRRRRSRFAATMIAAAECFLSGQVCASPTRIVVPQPPRRVHRRAAATFSAMPVGDPFDPGTAFGPLAMARQVDRVQGYIAKGIEEGATLWTGGGRPKHLDRGYHVEPTVFADVDNKAHHRPGGDLRPVLSVIPADNEEHAIDTPTTTIYGFNAAVFTPDVAHARRSPAGCARGRWDTTVSRSTTRSGLAGTNNPASGARAVPKARCPIWNTQDRPARSGCRWATDAAPDSHIQADVEHPDRMGQRP